MKTRKQRLLGSSISAVVIALVAAAGITACKEPPGDGGGTANPSRKPAAASLPASKPATSASASAAASSSATPKPSASAKASSSPTPRRSNTGSPPPAPTGGYTIKGFPGPENTGYPHGLPGDTRKPVTLTRYTGPMTITVAGTVIDSKDIVGRITIKAKNVVIKNSRIRSSNQDAIASTDDNANLLVMDTEVDGQGQDRSAGGIALIARTGFTLLRVNAHSSGDIVRLDGRATIQDSWLHNPNGLNGSQHNDVIQSTNATFVRILHNRLENQHTQTSCILLKADLGSISDVVVDSNLMNGGGYSFYWYDANYRITNGRVTNNRFMRAPTGGFWPKGGYHGTRAFQASQLPQWSGNVWHDTGQPIGM